MIYVASPYTSSEQSVMQSRYEMVKAFAAQQMRAGMTVYSPIVHGHDISTSHELPGDWEFWKPHCLAMLRKADSMIVLTIPGWEQSVGVLAEIAFCESCGIPIVFEYKWGHLA